MVPLALVLPLSMTHRPVKCRTNPTLGSCNVSSRLEVRQDHVRVALAATTALLLSSSLISACVCLLVRLMASPKFSVFLTQLAASLREEKGPELAYLLKPTSEHGRALVKDFRGNITVRLTPNTRYTSSFICRVCRGNHYHTTRAALRALGTRLRSSMSWL